MTLSINPEKVFTLKPTAAIAPKTEAGTDEHSKKRLGGLAAMVNNEKAKGVPKILLLFELKKR
jgi:hypothetical protein